MRKSKVFFIKGHYQKIRRQAIESKRLFGSSTSKNK